MHPNEVRQSPVIPRVQCPRCGSIMRLAQIEPEPKTSRIQRVTFDCGCGFTYRMSERVRATS